MKNEFYIEDCMLYDKPFIANGKILTFRKLWIIPNNDDECYHAFISPYCTNYFSDSNAPDDYLDIMDKRFLDGIKKYQKLSLFFYELTEFQSCSETKFYNNPIYNQIESQLIFIGYNVSSSQGTAITDGIYPIYLDEGISGNIIKNPEIDDILINDYGLLKIFKDCCYICDLNNKYNSDENTSWIPQKIYVDEYTYSIISKYSSE